MQGVFSGDPQVRARVVVPVAAASVFSAALFASVAAGGSLALVSSTQQPTATATPGATGTPTPTPTATTPPGPPVATHVTSIPTVGALFAGALGASQVLHLPHACSGSVVHSPHHDLVLTAGHCVAGGGVGYEFAPGYHDGLAPYGVWSVRRVYVNPSWRDHQDPQHDYAFLEIAPQSGHGIEDAVGAYQLGTAPVSGARVTVDGYAAGVDDEPLSCTSAIYATTGYPTFDCDGLADGTSGSPWISGQSVVGVIGGLHQGGCTPATSYSPAFGADVGHDWQRAAVGAAADVVPPAPDDGC
ncbi:MAG: hypothetical protein JWO57_1625 [Pseudonocardiales bacterium]|nr:hypothetical protein [Pseudonocardiales bacterium]